VIIHQLPDNRLLCIRQTTHALLAHEFCRHWGNSDFARPKPYTAVMLAISQHDNGWYEWEEQPCLREDGFPVDFLHGPTGGEKRALWQRSVDRTYAQHPYAGLLVARHAALLYDSDLAHTPADERAETETFLQNLAGLPHQVRGLWSEDNAYGPALCEKRLLANTYLLKFGDSASLQVCVPWGENGILRHCPVDGEDAYADIVMTVRDGVIGFDPWPYSVDEFWVSVHGKLLNQTHFPNEVAYHAALGSAPYHRLTWRVTRRI
jgi:hypothetical protein